MHCMVLKEEEKDSSDKTLIEKLKELLEEKITDLFDEMGLFEYSDQLGANFSDLISNTVNELATTLLQGTGFEGLMNVKPDKFASEWVDRINELYQMVKDIPNQLLAKVEGIADAVLGTTVISIRLMPCIHATITAISSIEVITEEANKLIT